MKKPITILLALGIGLSFGTRLADCNCETQQPEVLNHLCVKSEIKILRDHVLLKNAAVTGLSTNHVLPVNLNPE